MDQENQNQPQAEPQTSLQNEAASAVPTSSESPQPMSLEEAAAGAPSPAPEASMTSQPSAETPLLQEDSSGKKKLIKIGVIVVAAVILIGAILFLGKATLFKGALVELSYTDKATCENDPDGVWSPLSNKCYNLITIDGIDECLSLASTVWNGNACERISAETEEEVTDPAATACAALGGSSSGLEGFLNPGELACDTTEAVYLWSSESMNYSPSPELTCQIIYGGVYLAETERCEGGEVGIVIVWNGTTFVVEGEVVESDLAQAACNDVISGDFYTDGRENSCFRDEDDGRGWFQWDTDRYVFNAQYTCEISGATFDPATSECQHSTGGVSVLADSGLGYVSMSQVTAEEEMDTEEEEVIKEEIAAEVIQEETAVPAVAVPVEAVAVPVGAVAIPVEAEAVPVEAEVKNKAPLVVTETAPSPATNQQEIENLQSIIASLQQQLVATQQSQSATATAELAALEVRIARLNEELADARRQPAATTGASATGGGTATRAVSGPVIECPDGFVYQENACVPEVVEEVETEAREVALQRVTPQPQRDRDVLEELLAVAPQEDSRTAAARDTTDAVESGVSSAEAVSDGAVTAARPAGRAGATAAAAGTAAGTATAAARGEVSGQRLHGAFIQGQTGPGLLVYPVVLGAANAILYFRRRRMKK